MSVRVHRADLIRTIVQAAGLPRSRGRTCGYLTRVQLIELLTKVNMWRERLNEVQSARAEPKHRGRRSV